MTAAALYLLLSGFPSSASGLPPVPADNPNDVAEETEDWREALDRDPREEDEIA